MNVVHSLLRARDYQARPELAELCQWWREQGTGLCALVGIGGAGKTALADRFVRILPGGISDYSIKRDSSLPRPSHLFVFSFYVDPEPEVFLARLHDWLQAVLRLPPLLQGRSSPVTYPMLFQLMQQMPARTLMILDGMERIQDDGLRGGTFGQIQDSGLREFFLRVGNGNFPSISIVATTRFVLDDLEYARSPNYVELSVDHLPLDACISLLEERGVRGTHAELTAIAEKCGRHALTMDLTGGFISYFGGGDPQISLTFFDLHEFAPLATNPRDHRARYVAEQNQRFSRIAARYREAFKERDPYALMVLEYICLFRRGAVEPIVVRHFTHGRYRSEQVATVRARPVYVEFLDAQLTDAELRAKLDLLSDMRLIDANFTLLANSKNDSKNDQDRQLNLLRRLGSLYRDSPRLERGRSAGSRRSRGGDKGKPERAARSERTRRALAQRTRIYTVHPAVRDGFLLGYRADRARQGHLALIPELERFLDRRPGHEITLDQDSLNILEEIVYHALESGFHRLAFDVYRKEMGRFISLGWRYGELERGNRVLRAIAGDRSPRATPQLDDLKEDDRRLFFLEWAKFLLPLGSLQDVIACTAQVRRISSDRDDANGISQGWATEAGAHLLAGRFVAAEAAAAAGIHAASAIRNSWGALGTLKACHGIAGQAKSLCGNVDAAFAHFEQALACQRQLDGVDDRPLYGLRGAWYALLLLRLGRLDEAEQQSTANLAISEESSGVETFLAFPHLQLILAEVHLGRRQLKQATEAANTALNVGLMRNAKDILCWALLVESMTALETLRSGHNETPRKELIAARLRTSLEEGLSLAREHGFSAYYVDLLLCRAEYHLVMGDTSSSERDASVALFGARPTDAGVPHWMADPLDGSSDPSARGLFPPPGSGWPELYAATHTACDYRWGSARGFHMLAKSALLEAAQRLVSDTYVPARRQQLPRDVDALIQKGEAFLRLAQECCSALRAAGKEFDFCPTTLSVLETLKDLQGGVLTRYLVDSRNLSKSGPLQLFVSYAHEDRALVSELKDHLRGLEREGLVEIWTDDRIAPGIEWDPTIAAALKSADIVILAVSACFLASNYIYNTELATALAAQEAGRCVVVPVILRACDWSHQRFAILQVMPHDAKPVDSWESRDEAWTQVARGIRRVANDLRAKV